MLGVANLSGKQSDVIEMDTSTRREAVVWRFALLGGGLGLDRGGREKARSGW